nr:RNA-directed DNA polymerase, eukaryota [Tanacetum cinerariifolium]
VGNLNDGHLDGGCEKKVNGKVAGDDNSFVHTVGGKENSGSVNKMSDLMGSCRLKKSGMPRTGGSILSFMEEVVKVGQTMGYNMDGDSVGNSRGILCMWDPNSFCKSSFMRSNYFVIIRGLWLKSRIKLMIVVVYAPQEASEKLRYKSERFGLNFKAHDADIFNSFIHKAGLNEVHLGRSAFTWCHKSATKMTIFDYGPIPFRLYNYWLKVDGFDKLVRDAWNDAPGNKKNKIRNFMYKLKYTKEKIRGWLSTYRLNSRGALSKLKEDLRMFDEAIDKGNSPVEMVHKRLETLNKIQQVNNTHISEVAQKAKIKWVVEGDENTKFFHDMLNKKRNQRSIWGIMVNGTWIDDPVKRDDLEHMVTKEEVKKAVWDCGSDKSPGPDGFSFSFFRHFWSTIEKDIFEAINCFFTNEDMPNGCNSNFIALIPKIIDANMVKDLCPISLIESLYKVIAKIFTTRLVNLIDDLVNEKKHTLIFKVDFEKAYESVRWDFLDEGILNKFGFRNKWRMWIQSCLRSSRGSILVNGSTTEEFQFFKALKQDDTIFIGQWSELNIDTLVQVFECFYRASGLRINMCKSKIVGVNVEDGKIQNAASKLGCLVLKTPFKYLGTKVGENMSRKEAWKEVVDKTRVIKAIHGNNGKLDKDVIVGSQTCWTSIVKEARSLKGTGINMVNLIRLKMGNGDSSSFWEDKWYAGGVIKELFPYLYALELHKHATVRMKLMAPSLDNSFRRRVRSGAEES